MINEMILEIQNKLAIRLNKQRYEHTIGVMYTAACLAMVYEYSIEKAMLAGLLHDCAKCIPYEDNLKLCQDHNVPVTAWERNNPGLIHAKAGAILAETEYLIKDKEILHAICVHTTGEANMSLLDKIIYVADYIEPGRNKANHLDFLRKIAYIDINQCVAHISFDTLNYLSDKESAIDPTTQLTYDFYKAFMTETID